MSKFTGKVFQLEVHIVLKGVDIELLESIEYRIRKILDLYNDEIDIEIGGGLGMEVKNVQEPEPV